MKSIYTLSIFPFQPYQLLLSAALEFTFSD